MRGSWTTLGGSCAWYPPRSSPSSSQRRRWPPMQSGIAVDSTAGCDPPAAAPTSLPPDHPQPPQPSVRSAAAIESRARSIAFRRRPRAPPIPSRTPSRPLPPAPWPPCRWAQAIPVTRSRAAVTSERLHSSCSSTPSCSEPAARAAFRAACARTFRGRIRARRPPGPPPPWCGCERSEGGSPAERSVPMRVSLRTPVLALIVLPALPGAALGGA